MTDGHIHLEQGPYTLEWIDRFVDKAVQMQLDEIRLLEHCYRFEEFVPMYGSACAYSENNREWFRRRSGIYKLADYQALIQRVRERQYPVAIKFGLEVCYFQDFEHFTAELVRDQGFDFLLGSVHFVDGFAYDLKAEYWDGLDVDNVYRRYFENTISLAKCGIFDGLGHPDAIKLFGHKPSFPLTEYYEQLAAALAASGMYADQNSGVARRCPDTASIGMAPELLRMLQKHNVPIITSSDAHRPEDIGYKIREMQEALLKGDYAL